MALASTTTLVQNSTFGRISPRGNGDQATFRVVGMPRLFMRLMTAQAAYRGFGFLCRQSAGAQAACNQNLVPKHRHLDQRSPAELDRPLPAQPTTLVDQLDVAVTLRGGALGRVAPWRAASTRRPPPASSRASGRRADAAPHRSSTGSRPGSAPSGLCDNASRWPCKASGSRLQRDASIPTRSRTPPAPGALCANVPILK